MRILLDTKCDTCNFTHEDFDKPNLASYGKCPKCDSGTMLKVMSAPRTVQMVPSKTGKTTNGMKWSVDPTPRKFDAKTGKFGSQV